VAYPIHFDPLNLSYPPVMEYLLEHKVLISVRYTSGVGGVRISSHFFNTKEDLDRAVEHIRNFLRS
jgi:hypothetical protein